MFMRERKFKSVDYVLKGRNCIKLLKVSLLNRVIRYVFNFTKDKSEQIHCEKPMLSNRHQFAKAKI